MHERPSILRPPARDKPKRQEVVLDDDDERGSAALPSTLSFRSLFSCTLFLVPPLVFSPLCGFLLGQACAGTQAAQPSVLGSLWITRTLEPLINRTRFSSYSVAPLLHVFRLPDSLVAVCFCNCYPVCSW